MGADDGNKSDHDLPSTSKKHRQNDRKDELSKKDSTSKKESSSRKDDPNRKESQTSADARSEISRDSSCSPSDYSLESHQLKTGVMCKPKRRARGKSQVGLRKRKPVNKHGRVVKKRRRAVRAPRARRTRTRVKRDDSICTVFTRVSSMAGDTRAPCCKYCGHQCCYRRYQKMKIRRKGYKRKNIRKNPRTIRKREQSRLQRRLRKVIQKKEEALQTGSRCHMLSSLFIKTNATLEDQLPLEDRNYLRITVDMICEALGYLTKWKAGVSVAAIMDFIKAHHPVNSNDEELIQELKEKLQLAFEAGIVSNRKVEEYVEKEETKLRVVNDPDYWYQSTMVDRSCDLERSNVTNFGNPDSLNPLPSRMKEQESHETSDQPTNTNETRKVSAMSLVPEYIG